jgi:hypothetical protein
MELTEEAQLMIRIEMVLRSLASRRGWRPRDRANDEDIRLATESQLLAILNEELNLRFRYSPRRCWTQRSRHIAQMQCTSFALS